MKYIFALGIFFLFTLQSNAQEITEKNTDSLYFKALDAYKNQNFPYSLKLVQRGLELAPEYHDIRILEIRDYWALKNYEAADKDLQYLLKEAANYPGVSELAEQRISRFLDDEEALRFLSHIQQTYPEDLRFQIQKAQSLLKLKRRKKARELALQLVQKKGISGAQRYQLQTLLNRTVSDEIGVVYQYINFSDDYSRNHPWNTGSVEYQHNFNRTAVIGRATYSDRGYDHGNLYEIETYPVFNDRLYAFANIGVSNGELFPNVRTSLSLYYNFAEIFEVEAGTRVLFFNNSSYATGIVGLTAYQGRFYFNVRSFLGPKRANKLVQNYQANVRYYFQNADNYLFLRIGSGISPDESTIFTQVQNNPTLDAYYGNFGLNKTIGAHHIFQLGGGLLFEDITSERDGYQFIGTASYRFRF